MSAATCAKDKKVNGEGKKASVMAKQNALFTRILAQSMPKETEGIKTDKEILPSYSDAERCHKTGETRLGIFCTLSFNGLY